MTPKPNPCLLRFSYIISVLLSFVAWKPCMGFIHSLSTRNSHNFQRCKFSVSFKNNQLNLLPADSCDGISTQENENLNSEMNIQGPFSLRTDDLGKIIEGSGRALAVWECFRIGVDPLIFFGYGHEEFLKKDKAFLSSIQSIKENSFFSGNEHETIPVQTQIDEIFSLLPTNRRTNGLGKLALEKLSKLYKKCVTKDVFTSTDVISLESTIGFISEVSISSDGTTKLLVKLLTDGLEVETVIIPWFERGSSTLCISSQVGCRQGCTFCATGRMGLARSLSPDEILLQFFLARKFARIAQTITHNEYSLPEIDNVVFMGMGEPSDNVFSVTTAANTLVNRKCFNLSQTKVTISTVAPSPQSFLDLSKAQCAIAWSVHAVNDDIRKILVPTTNFSMKDLQQAFIQSLLKKPKKLRAVMLEVVLISNINDSPDDANDLIEFSREIMDSVPNVKLVVNLIPFNSIEKSFYQKPPDEVILTFQSILVQNGIFTFLRRERGADKDAACGQLATRKQTITTDRRQKIIT